jgi:hypothetical protein
MELSTTHCDHDGYSTCLSFTSLQFGMHQANVWLRWGSDYKNHKGVTEKEPKHGLFKVQGSRTMHVSIHLSRVKAGRPNQLSIYNKGVLQQE